VADRGILEQFRRANPSGVFLDFDGTLSEIVARPDQARVVPGAGAILTELAGRHQLVAVISGRRSDEVRTLLGVPGIEVFGHYGIEDPGTGGVRAPVVVASVNQAAERIPGTWVEDKGASLAVHYRGAGEPMEAERRLRPALEAIARASGLILLPGKMVLELAPPNTPGKGAIIRREARARPLAGCLFAGDDRADLAAFDALDELREEETVTVKVAVRSEETPPELIERADLVVERPLGLLNLLERI
jgi:trehalose 6-phosphate phosphatase